MRKASSILTLISGVVLLAAGVLGLIQACARRPENWR